MTTSTTDVQEMLPEGPADLNGRVVVELLAQQGPEARERIRQKCADDVCWFIDYILYTYDPRPDADAYDLPFILYDFQRDMIEWLQERIRLKEDGLVEKSRDMGVTWVMLAFILHQWLFTPGSNILVGSRKEDLVDNRTDDSLFGRLERMLKFLPGWMLPKNFNWDRHRQWMKLQNPENGSWITGESSNPHFSRQGRYSLIVMDEGAFWDYFEQAWRSAAEATRTRVVVSTPNGRNSFYRLREWMAEQNPRTIHTVHWRLHPDKDDEWFAHQKTRMSDVDLQQELEISYAGSIRGVVYPDWASVAKGDYPFVPGWPLYAAIDFGIADPTAIIWLQRNPKTGKVRIIDCYQNNDKPADFYVPILSGELPGRWKYGEKDEQGVYQYNYTDEEMHKIAQHATWGRPIVFGDPAGNQRSQISGETILDRYREHGIHIVTKDNAQDFRSRYSATQMMLRDVEVNLPECNLLDQAITSAAFPNRAEDSMSTSAIQKPIHNWSSHLRSALEYAAVNLPSHRNKGRPKPSVRRMIYDTA